jgi:ABC-type uncharacterized transport system permease subunit
LRWRGVNEVLSTILLNFIAIAFVHWLVDNPLKGSEAPAIGT